MRFSCRPLSSFVFFAVFAFAGGACGGAASSTSTSPEPEPVADTSEQAAPEADGANPGDGPGYSQCEPTFVRQRECQDVFLPALVDLRVSLDIPKGIAAAEAEQGRDALLAMARQEYASDSTDEAIAATCESMRSNAPAELLEMAEGQSARCLETTDDCDAFVECILPVIKAGIAARQG